MFVTFALSGFQWPVQAELCGPTYGCICSMVLGLFNDALSAAAVIFPGM